MPNIPQVKIGNTTYNVRDNETMKRLNTFERKIDGRLAPPAMELGDIGLSTNPGNITYYNSTSRVRVCRDKTFYASIGDVVGLDDYDGKKFLIYRQVSGNTYESINGGWCQDDTVVTKDGNYVALIAYNPETTITDITDLTSLFFIKKNSALDGITEQIKAIDDLTARASAYDYVQNNFNFERGDLYINSSGEGRYYNSNSRLRTIAGHPITLKANDVVGLKSYTNNRYIVYKKVSEGQYETINGGGWKQQDQRIKVDGEYEVLVSHQDGANITENELSYMKDLFLVKSEYGVIRETTNIQNMTDVYKSELATTIRETRDKTTSKALVFGIVTDTHFDDKRAGFYDQTMENLERLNNALQFNAILHLGDIINGYDPIDTIKNHYQHAVSKFVSISPERAFMVIGNHDNNNGAGDDQKFTDKMLYSYIQRFSNATSGRPSPTSSNVDSPSSNYYLDYPEFNVRAIMFDSCYYGSGISTETIAWVRNAMTTAPENYHFILFTHQSTESKCNAGVTITNAAEFKAMLATFKDRIYCYIHGHTHFDYVGYDNEFAQIALDCAVPDQPATVALMPEGAILPERTLHTVTQDCISILVVLPEENKVELVRFGAGDNRTIPFRQG